MLRHVVITLMMQAVRTSATTVSFSHTTRRSNPDHLEDYNEIAGRMDFLLHVAFDVDLHKSLSW
jgi:hypothetical protein